MNINEIKNVATSINMFTTWRRFDHKQAEYTTILHDGKRYTLLKSYDTIVGVYDIDNDTFYELGKYSPTTSKQVTQFCWKVLGGATRVLLERPDWNNKDTARNYVTPCYW